MPHVTLHLENVTYYFIITKTRTHNLGLAWRYLSYLNNDWVESGKATRKKYIYNICIEFLKNKLDFLPTLPSGFLTVFDQFRMILDNKWINMSVTQFICNHCVYIYSWGPPGWRSQLSARLLVSAQVVISGSWDWALHQALRSVGNLLQFVFLHLSPSLCLSPLTPEINKSFQNVKKKRYSFKSDKIWLQEENIFQWVTNTGPAVTT